MAMVDGGIEPLGGVFMVGLGEHERADCAVTAGKTKAGAACALIVVDVQNGFLPGERIQSSGLAV
jgi:hypothetical protein